MRKFLLKPWTGVMAQGGHSSFALGTLGTLGVTTPHGGLDSLLGPQFDVKFTQIEWQIFLERGSNPTCGPRLQSSAARTNLERSLCVWRPAHGSDVLIIPPVTAQGHSFEPLHRV